MTDVENYITEQPVDSTPPQTVVDSDDLEAKREALATLACIGTTKDFLGTEISLVDVEKLSAKDVDKYFNRYKNVIGKQVTSALVQSGIQLASRIISYLIPVDDVEALREDLNNDELVRRELLNFAGLLVLRGGRLVALASGIFQVGKHVKLTPLQTVQEPLSGSEEDLLRKTEKILDTN